MSTISIRRFSRKHIAAMAIGAALALGLVLDAGSACDNPWLTSSTVSVR